MKLRFTSVLFVSLAAFAAAPSLAQKPGAEDALDPARETYRGQGISMCVAALHSAEGITPDELEAICGCTLERLMQRRGTGSLPPLAPGELRRAAGGRILACTIETQPERASAVARWLADSPPAGQPAPAVTSPLPTQTDADKPPADSGPSDPSASGLSDWLNGLSLPRWMTGSGLPLWAWLPIGLLVLALLRALLRSRRDGRDLIGPPASMRRTVAPPRPADFPRER